MAEDAPFMTVKEMVQEVRDDFKKLREDVDDIKSTMVTKKEFEGFLRKNVITFRWRITTTVSIVLLVIAVIGLLIEVFS